MPIFKFEPSKAKSQKEIITTPKSSRGVENNGADNADNQGVIFQYVQADQGQKVLDPHDVVPKIEGSEEQPDVYLKMQLLGFHVDESLVVDRKSAVTFRLIVGPQADLLNDKIKPIFWALSAGIKLHNLIKNGEDKDSDSNIDLNESFNGKPIEIPAAKALIQLDVIKHREVKWWQKTFELLRSGTGSGILSLIGFPAVTQKAIGILDNTLNQIDRMKNKEYLFQGKSIKVTLSQKAENETEIEGSKIGSLNEGIWIMTRVKDRNTLRNTPAYFNHQYSKLIPVGVKPIDSLASDFDDPFANVTYAVFKADIKSTQLTVDFSA